MIKDTLKRWNTYPFLSVGLVCLNVLMYLLDGWLDGLLLAEGNLNIYDVLEGRQYGRILWSMFLHLDLNHLFNNMIILLFLGAMLERITGHLMFGAVYMLSGIVGNLCSLIYKMSVEPASRSIGASGAVFGLDGLLLALMLFALQRPVSVTPMRVAAVILLSLYNGFTSTNIDNAAHVGGLFAGFILGCLFCVGQRIFAKLTAGSNK